MIVDPGMRFSADGHPCGGVEVVGAAASLNVVNVAGVGREAPISPKHLFAKRELVSAQSLGQLTPHLTNGA